MFKHLERLAKEDEEKFWRRFAFHSYYDSEASDAFPDILTAYFRATLRAMLVTPAMMDLSDVTNNFSAGDTAFYVAVFPRWPRILWQCGIRPKRTALLVFPQNSITKLAGTVPHFFIGLRHGKIAFRPDRVDFVSYELDR
ncbi:MAG: hypothetical protein HZA51_14685 [Planctomycetes bacterium]|nr:hypothetical protein [Planctomycetota bacterium]